MPIPYHILKDIQKLIGRQENRIRPHTPESFEREVVRPVVEMAAPHLYPKASPTRRVADAFGTTSYPIPTLSFVCPDCAGKMVESTVHANTLVCTECGIVMCL